MQSIGRGSVGIWIGALAIVSAAIGAPPARAGSLSPLVTEEVETIGSGRGAVSLSAAYSRNERFPNFTPAGAIARQDLVGGPRLGVRLGVGAWAEVEASFEMLYLDEKLENGDRHQRFGAGDARLFTKVRVLREKEWWPSLGARFGAKLPNANFDDRLGTDETDFEIDVLASRDVAVGQVHVNLGLALLGNPGPAVEGDTSFESGGQDDLVIWGVAYASPWMSVGAEDSGVRVLTEFVGNAGTRFDNERAAYRLGGQWRRGPWSLDVGASVGLVTASEDFGVSGGVTYAFDFADWFAE